MSARPRTIAGIVIACLGLLLPLVEVVAYWVYKFSKAEHYDVNPWVMFGGAIVAFVGGALIDFRSAKDITNVVVTSGVTILGALPFGKRWTDRVAQRQSGSTVAVAPGKPETPPTEDP